MISIATSKTVYLNKNHIGAVVANEALESGQSFSERGCLI